MAKLPDNDEVDANVAQSLPPPNFVRHYSPINSWLDLFLLVKLWECLKDINPKNLNEINTAVKF